MEPSDTSLWNAPRVGTIQLVVGVLLLIFGLLDVIFDHNLLFKAAREAYSGVKPPPVLAPAAAKSAAESNAEKARDLMRAMESCESPVPPSVCLILADPDYYAQTPFLTR